MGSQISTGEYIISIQKKNKKNNLEPEKGFSLSVDIDK